MAEGTTEKLAEALREMLAHHSHDTRHEIKLRDKAREALAAYDAALAATPAAPQPEDPMQELAQKSGMELWLSYLEKKEEVESLREQLAALAATPAPAEPVGEK